MTRARQQGTEGCQQAGPPNPWGGCAVHPPPDLIRIPCYSKGNTDVRVPRKPAQPNQDVLNGTEGRAKREAEAIHEELTGHRVSRVNITRSNVTHAIKPPAGDGHTRSINSSSSTTRARNEPPPNAQVGRQESVGILQPANNDGPHEPRANRILMSCTST